MNAERLAEIRKRCEDATAAGHWTFEFVAGYWRGAELDEDFIRNASSDIPFLLSHIERQEEAIEAAKEAMLGVHGEAHPGDHNWTNGCVCKFCTALAKLDEAR